MAESSPPAPGVRAQIPHEEPCRAELAPLPDVHELVSNQVTVVLVPAPNEDPPVERHRGDAGREDRHVHEAGAVEVLHRHVPELLSLRRLETPRHSVPTG